MAEGNKIIEQTFKQAEKEVESLLDEAVQAALNIMRLMTRGDGNGV